jgi:hypothetical protein
MLALALVIAACGGEDMSSTPTPPREKVTVTFEYRAPTMLDPMIREERLDCVLLVGETHIHLGWRNFEAVNLRQVPPDLFTITFDDVPVGGHRIRVSDGNACRLNITGAVTTLNVFANGVLLTRRVETPGSGIEPGFGLSVDSDGSVTP